MDQAVVYLHCLIDLHSYMKLRLFQADAFSDKLFRGNPAAVVLMNEWIPVPLMQQIASENNLSETAFLVPGEGLYNLRWFTPTTEVALCGHATLAAAHVLFRHMGYKDARILFHTLSGMLSVTLENELLYLDFPVTRLQSIPTPKGLTAGLGLRPYEVLHGGEYLVAMYKDENENQKIAPDFMVLARLPYLGICVTAAGSGEVDFVSRFFAPAVGIPEDPVTGSVHTALIPYWSARLNKKRLLARQVSLRGGSLHCEFLDDRVKIGGMAVTYLEGTITTELV